jgi:hypothetical protein
MAVNDAKEIATRRHRIHKGYFVVLVLFCGYCLHHSTCTPLLAHHAIAAKFDPSKPSTLNGTVTHVDWRSPHVHVLMNVREGERIVNWAVELENPLDLERSGWNRDSVKPGMQSRCKALAPGMEAGRSGQTP